MDKKKDKQIIIKVICVIASFVFWLYIANAENPERDEKITVPVTLENVDALSKAKLALLNDQKFEVTIRVKGPMLEVNALNISKFSLKADLSLYALNKGINRVPVSVSNKPEDIDILDPESLKVDINLDNLIEKSVPVRLDIPVTTKTGYAAFTPITNPSTVYVSGAEEYVKNVTYVQAKMELKDLEADAEHNIPLQPYNDAGRVVKDVSVNPQTVNVVVPVKKTKSVKVSVETKGSIGAGMELKGIDAVPATIDIAGDANILKDISEIKTEAIDLSKISEDRTVEVKMILDKVITVSGNNTVTVKISVDKFKQKNLSVNIKFNNLGNNLVYKSDITNVSIVLTGAQSLIDTITESDIQCTVDLSNLGEEIHTIPVNIVVPEGITIESASPKNVKVTISKKQQESTTQ